MIDLQFPPQGDGWQKRSLECIIYVCEQKGIQPISMQRTMKAKFLFKL
jgi:hypothetical protein